MDTQSAQVEQLPKALRSFIRAGTYFQKVLDTAEVNAQARAAAGQPPNLLDDVMKDGQVHIANLEEVLADITGRTKAKTVVELMTHAHGLMGIYNSVSDIFSGADEAGAGDRAGDPPRASSQASAQANGASSPTFRPEFTGAARRAAKAAASAAAVPGTAPASPPHEAAPPPADHTATAPTAASRTSLDDTLNALTMQVARHLQTFQQAIAAEQTELRGRMIHQSLRLEGLRARIQVLESKLIPAAGAAANIVAPAVERVAALANEPAAETVNALANERAVETPTEPAVACPVEPQPQKAANVEPATLATHDDDFVAAKVTACAAKVSSMIIDVQTQAHAECGQQRAQYDARDEDFLKLEETVTRLEAIVNKTGGQHLVEGDQGAQPTESDQGLPIGPPSESRLE